MSNRFRFAWKGGVATSAVGRRPPPYLSRSKCLVEVHECPAPHDPAVAKREHHSCQYERRSALFIGWLAVARLDRLEGLVARVVNPQACEPAVPYRPDMRLSPLDGHTAVPALRANVHQGDHVVSRVD